MIYFMWLITLRQWVHAGGLTPGRASVISRALTDPFLCGIDFPRRVAREYRPDYRAWQTKRNPASDPGDRQGGMFLLSAMVGLSVIMAFCVVFFPDLGFGFERRHAGPARAAGSVQSDLTSRQVLAAEDGIMRFTNDVRRRNGLVSFSTSPALVFLARTHSRNMCRKKVFQHESDELPDGWQRFEQRLRVIKVRSGGENIAYHTLLKDTDKWARLVVRGLMNSPEHRKNILNPDYRYLGIGVHPCSNSIGYATQVFSSESGRVPEVPR